MSIRPKIEAALSATADRLNPGSGIVSRGVVEVRAWLSVCAAMLRGVEFVGGRGVHLRGLVDEVH